MSDSLATIGLVWSDIGAGDSVFSGISDFVSKLLCFFISSLHVLSVHGSVGNFECALGFDNLETFLKVSGSSFMGTSWISNSNSRD